MASVDVVAFVQDHPTGMPQFRSMNQPTGGGSYTAMMRWTLYGAIAQLALAAIGHWADIIKPHVYALGVTIATTAGVWFATVARVPAARSATGGAVVGGVCAVIGATLSTALGDTPAPLLVSMVSSTAGGAIGAFFIASTR
jgi:hypothetical protein